MPKKNNPGCKCCNACVFAQDNFPGSSVGAIWQQDAGMWSVGGAALTTSSTNAAIKCTTVNPLITAVTVTVIIGAGVNSGDLLRVMVDYQDQNNYKYAEFIYDTTQANRYIKIGERVAGTDTVYYTSPSISSFPSILTDVLLPGQPFQYRICFSDANLLDVTTAESAGFGMASYQFPGNNTNPYVALGTGATLTGTATFSLFSANQYKPNCSVCFTDCIGFEDDFDRANASPLDNSWSNANGALGAPIISLVGDKASCNQAGAVYYPPPISAIGGGPALVTVTVDVSADTDGDQAGMTCDDITVMVQFGSTPLLIVHNTSFGVIARIAVSAALNSTHTIQLWWMSGTVVVKYDKVAMFAVWENGGSLNPSTSNPSASYIVSGGSNTGTVTWDNFVEQYEFNPFTILGDPYNCPCFCNCCDPADVGFTQWEVITGNPTMGGPFYPQADVSGCAPGDQSLTLATSPISIAGGTASAAGTTGAGTLVITHGEVTGNNAYLGVDGNTYFVCEWGATFIWSSNAGCNVAGGINYYLSPVNGAIGGYGGCTGTVQTLTIDQDPAIYLAMYGFTPPSSITVEGIP